MQKYHITLKDVYLDYPSTMFNTKTLKQAVFELIKLQKPAKILDDVHALRGFCLEVNEGEKVGIIGENGAGKSTLLKAVAGLYPIKSGVLSVYGHIRSLFDLSLGFEQDATGRENIMYRGLLLGESPDSIKRKTEEIIDFAELGNFIDYPIKSYSAGMYVRLAFAISTMVNGDILLLDEVFSVGDAKFVKKAKSRIIQLMEDAKIMLFVSHDHASVLDICNRVIWVEKGRVVMDGDPKEVLYAYKKKTVGE